jgi:hypothetical protein
MNNFKTRFSKISLRGCGVLFKWLIMIAAYSFLVYKLVTFTQYEQLFMWWKQMAMTQFWWLAAVLVLLPVNWLLEAVKWEMLTSNIQKISLKTAIKAVLAGISTGFFTPNRVGELIGRVMYLNVENRKAGATMSIVNSLTQNLVMAMCGVPACLVYFYSTTNVLEVDSENFLLGLLAFLLLFGLLYFSLPKLSKYLAETTVATKISSFTAGLSAYTRSDLVRIMGISLLRYFVFCSQFFLMLQFFGIQLQPLEALIAIPTNYLFVTFSPSVAFSEAAVRSSYAVLFIGSYSGQVINIALAGICIWIVNFVVPMLVGSVVMVGEKAD